MSSTGVQVGSGGSSGSSGGGKKRKNPSWSRLGAEKKAQYPSTDAKRVANDIIRDYFRSRDIMQLTNKYTQHGYDGMLSFQVYMENKIRAALAGDEWREDRDKLTFNKWVTDKAGDATWNLKQLIYAHVPPTTTGPVPSWEEQFFIRVNWWQERSKAVAKSRNRNLPWMRANAARDLGSAMITLGTNAEVLQLDAYREGGYARVRRVRIRGDSRISETWELAGKTPKTMDLCFGKTAARQEAMVVPSPHFGIINYFAVHLKLNEGYSKWWNGGSIREMMNVDKLWGSDLDSRELSGYRGTEQEIEEIAKLKRFRAQRSKLSWALLIIMDHVHKNNIMHNDLSPDNILLHFPTSTEAVHIGVCDWGLACSTQLPKASPYVFETQGKMRRTLEQRWWVAPEIACVHNPSNVHVDGSTVRVFQTLSSETFAVGKIASHINDNNHYDSELFVDNTGGTVYASSLKKLFEIDPESRHTISRIIRRFMAPPFNWTEPMGCFRTTME